MMSESCKDAVLPYITEMRVSAQKTMKTGKETGFTIGIAPYGISHKYDAAEDDYQGLNLPRPPLPDKPLLHFHTHVPDDTVMGMSGGDTVYPFFSQNIYPFYCVAATGYNKIYCYRPNEVVNHKDYRKKIQEQKDLSLEHAKIIFMECPSHAKNVNDFLSRNDLKNLIKYETRHCPGAANIMRKIVYSWNDFIPKTKCAEFPIKED